MNTLRYAWRSLARSPGFVVVAVLALGFGLALSTTMFAVMDAVMNPYMPYKDPDTLYRVRWWYSRRDVHVGPGVFYQVFHDQARSYSGIVPISYDRAALEEDEGRELFFVRVTPRFFPLSGVQPWLGRAFTESDGSDVVVLGNATWRRLFGKRTNLAGATVKLGDRVLTVVGVMPQGTNLPSYAGAWVPYPANADPARSTWMPLVRLKPGVTKAQADAELKAIGATLTQLYASRTTPISFELDPVRQREERLRDIQKAMIGAALSVLLIACVNLAHLMLARGLARRRELALRMALGAGRAAVVWQMFAECAIITLAGSALGALGALWGADIITYRLPPDVGWVGVVAPVLSWRVFAGSAALAAASAVLFGLIPAVRVAWSLNLDEPLKDGAGTTGRIRNRYDGLVVAEVAIALVLMMGGGLLLRTVYEARRLEFSFNANTLLQTQIGFSRDSTKGMRRDDIMAAIAAVPGVRAVAYQSNRIAVGDAMTGEMAVGDSTRTIRGAPLKVSWNYLQVHGLPILKGRDFEPGDESGTPVAILNSIAAQRLYPNGDAVGRMIKLGAPAREAPWVRIVGVARAAIIIGQKDADVGGPQVWVSDTTQRSPYGGLLIRTERRDPKIAAAVRRALRTLPGMWYSYVEGMADQWESEIRSRLFLANVFVTMGLVALGLAALGLYGVLAYAVNQRMREFAVRIALGARPQQLFRMVMHDGFVMLLAGVGLGAFVALAAARMLDAVLPETILPSDVISLVACEAVLLAAGFGAAFAPARRAVRANPLDILRAT